MICHSSTATSNDDGRLQLQLSTATAMATTAAAAAANSDGDDNSSKQVTPLETASVSMLPPVTSTFLQWHASTGHHNERPLVHKNRDRAKEGGWVVLPPIPQQSMSFIKCIHKN
jgi:hypothetical protein